MPKRYQQGQVGYLEKELPGFDRARSKRVLLLIGAVVPTLIISTNKYRQLG
jgi:hypothetical protein